MFLTEKIKILQKKVKKILFFIKNQLPKYGTFATIAFMRPKSEDRLHLCVVFLGKYGFYTTNK